MRILITGASGFIGSQLGRLLSDEHDVLGLVYRSRLPLSFPHHMVDLKQERPVADIMRQFRPQVVVHAAAVSRVLACEKEPDVAVETNVVATGRLARWAERLYARMVFVSSDQVFSGGKGQYIESDPTDPINHYGRLKVEAEKLVLDCSSSNLVVRSNSVVGPGYDREGSFSDWILHNLQAEKRIVLYHDQHRSPIHIRRLLQLLAFVTLNPVAGILHAGGRQRLSRTEVGFILTRSYGLSADSIEVTSIATHEQSQVLTRDNSFNIARFRQLLPSACAHSLEEEFAEDLRASEVRV